MFDVRGQGVTIDTGMLACLAALCGTGRSREKGPLKGVMG